MNSDLIAYYRDRAAEYDEEVYQRMERQPDRDKTIDIFQKIFYNKEVLEVGCGTAYWTEKISQTAKSILAVDINKSMIDIARTKNFSNTPVDFLEADFNDLHLKKQYESLFGGFIWSHIKLEDLPSFINCIRQYVKAGGVAVFIDNNYVQGSSIPISQTDNLGNTFQTRKLEDGSQHLVLKNFPDEAFIRKITAAPADKLEFKKLKFFWIAILQVL